MGDETITCTFIYLSNGLVILYNLISIFRNNWTYFCSLLKMKIYIRLDIIQVLLQVI